MKEIQDYLEELGMGALQTEQFVEFDEYADKSTFMTMFNINENPKPILIPLGQKIFAIATLRKAPDNLIEIRGQIGYGVQSMDGLRLFKDRNAAQEHLKSVDILTVLDDVDAVEVE